ncbi:MAG TPA: NAD(P)H-hydrate dehydratase [Actinobacteria bacterium]|nr:NAD(P)H-hydrate dehydratase [Actinomycetota bacterium]
MLLAKVDQMRTIEEEAIAKQGLTLNELMKRAGAEVAREAMEMLPQAGRVLIFCGKGNNGGDGFIAAHLLAQKNHLVEVIMLSAPDNFSGAARQAFTKISDEASIKKTSFKSFNAKTCAQPDLVIDAVFGFGLKGKVRGVGAGAITTINALGSPVLSVDIPSGVNSDTGQIDDNAVKATRTITFTCPKAGMAIDPGVDFIGSVRVADIGIDKKIVATHAKVCQGSRLIARPLLPKRRPATHKGECGRVLVIGGSVGMTGAVAMCSQAALKIGAGLVTLGIPESLNHILEVKLTEVMTKPLPETPERTLRAKALDIILEMAPRADVVVVGPGMSTHASTATLVQQLVTSIENPLIIDADGLNALAPKPDLLSKRPGPTVLTPHPGELGHLLGVSPSMIQSDRLSWAEAASNDWKVTVILKGARTIIAGGDCLHVNPTGNPGMATAGTGDILAGMLAGLVAQGLPPYPASVLATYLHGLAGDIAVKYRTELALVATDLLHYLPAAIKEIEAIGDKKGRLKK